MTASGRWQALNAGLSNRGKSGHWFVKVLTGVLATKSSRYLGTDLGAAITIGASFRHTFSVMIGCASALGWRLSA